MKAGFLEKLIERLGRIGPEEVQNYFLRLAQEKGFLETVFNAIQEGIIVTDAKGRITYLNDAACELFGLASSDAIGKRLDERVRGLDWESLAQSEGPVTRDIEIFYPANRFINFYIVPLLIGHREAGDKIDKDVVDRESFRVIPWLRQSMRLSLVHFVASFLGATLAQISKALFSRCRGKPVGARLSVDSSGKFSAYSGHDRSSRIREAARALSLSA